MPISACQVRRANFEKECWRAQKRPRRREFDVLQISAEAKASSERFLQSVDWNTVKSDMKQYATNDERIPFTYWQDVQATNILKLTKRQKIVSVGKSSAKRNEYWRRIYIIEEKRILKNAQKQVRTGKRIFTRRRPDEQFLKTRQCSMKRRRCQEFFKWFDPRRKADLYFRNNRWKIAISYIKNGGR